MFKVLGAEPGNDCFQFDSSTDNGQNPMIESLLVNQTKAEFLENYFLRLPFAQPQGCGDLVKRKGWEIMDAILSSPEADVMVVKSGERWPESRTPKLDEAQKLFQEGYTLLVRHAERQDEELSRIAQGFAEDFRAAVDVHLYWTPGESFGFGWHYDVEDVFILQLEGTKQYSLRKNTVNPWPVLENMPADLRYEREIMPLLQCELAAGDWLYIPHGYWHKADAKSDSLSLAVGVMMPSALDVLDFARRRLIESIRWRQRLPMLEGDDPQSQVELFAELGEEISSLFSDPAFLRQFREHQKDAANPEIDSP